MPAWITDPWPWYVSGPLMGLIVPLLLVLCGRTFGISKSLQHVCAATLPGRIEYFAYDWKSDGGWNLLFALGVLIGGGLAAAYLIGYEAIAISPATRADLAALGFSDLTGLVPAQLISWRALARPAGLVAMALGGFLLGFGARYAGGCTSGHGITGLATLQKSSLIAVLGFFAGGLLVTHLVLPILFRAGL